MEKCRLKQHTLLFLFCMLVVDLPVRASFPELSFDVFTQENGLPHNQIQSIYQDNKGWMWIGTSQGISRFDGYTFVNYLPNPADSSSLNGNLVRVITQDSKGNLLIGTENGGLNVYEPEKERFFHPLKNYHKLNYRDISVNAIAEDINRNLYLGTDFNILVLDSAGKITPLEPVFANERETFIGGYVRNLVFDHRGILWIGTNRGLYFYNPQDNTAEYFSLPFNDNQNREVWEIFPDDDGTLLVGTYSAGLFKVSLRDNSVTSVKLAPELERTETVRSISKGAFGEYWIGTRGGLYIYSAEKGVTGFYQQDERDTRSISNNSILSIFHDSQGETWIGTRHGLNLLAKSKQVFHHFGALPGDDGYLNSSIVYALWIDDDGQIWIGTEDGGINIYNQQTGKYRYLTAGSRDGSSISQNCIKAFLDDNLGNLWVGTYLGGIDVIDLKTGKISHFKYEAGKKGTLSDNRVWDFCLDRNNDIWIATSGGVDKYNRKANTFEHYPQLNSNKQVSWIEPDSDGNLWMGSLDEVIVYNMETQQIRRYSEHSRSMYEDTKKRVWIATMDKGIAVYSAGEGAVRYYDEKDGLANNHTLRILEDADSNLWISTSNGLSKFNSKNEIFRNFTSKDGLSNNQFCYGAAFKTEAGHLLFGSVSGFNMFNPLETVAEDHHVPIVLTDLKIFNKSVTVGDTDRSVLQKSISETDHLVLDYNQNMFTVEFAALNFVNSDKNLYSYTLEGFNDRWSEPGTNRSATFTNLNPGDYLLRIQKVIPGIQRPGNELQLKITVMPPFWKTRWFLTLLVLFIAFLIYILVRFFINREKIKNQLVMERVNARKLHELDMMKLRFFTNISHEIRTPLTLILGPIDKILKQNMTIGEIKENLRLVDRNAKNLNKLISQLLDFRKLESGNLKLNFNEGDLVLFIRGIVHSFNDLAHEKQVKFSFNTIKKQLFAKFDPDKIEKIVNNLLSNAFKFTGPGGTVTVNLSLVFDMDDDDFLAEEKEKQFIEIVVRDTGRGIPEKSQGRIFQRFFQADNEESGSGTGIGLAMVKELVNLHKGKVLVSSKPGKGTKFTVRIPFLPAVPGKENKADSEEKPDEISVEAYQLKDNVEASLHSKIMLIAEDNADVRQFIAGHFSSTFKIVEAVDGAAGLEKALETVPDIIISDVLMPQLDGYEFCKRIKSDERTSHIPVLLLTALHSRENELKGLTTGADDYITKPFDINLLQAKVESVLTIRESLKAKYSRNIVLEPKNVVISSPDERFLQKTIQVVEDNISNSELDIESFSEMVGVSRMQLYRKLHALTDMTVKEFIRDIRLKRAVQLLLQKKMSISEVAYAVGFNDLSHFRKCFKNVYGMSASSYITKYDQEQMTHVS